jgi:hypothetical protein
MQKLVEVNVLAFERMNESSFACKVDFLGKLKTSVPHTETTRLSKPDKAPNNP